MTRPLVVVGDALLDRDLEGRVERLCPDAPAPVVDEPVTRSRPGGAGLAALLAAAGRPVTLLTALSSDEPGRELADLLGRAGVEVVDLGLGGPTPQKVRVRAGGRTLLRIDHGPRRPPPVGPVPERAAAALAGASAVLVSDYGRGVAAADAVRQLLAALSARTPLVWDPHPRGPEPVEGVRLATPNRSEVSVLVPEPAGDGLGPLTARARALLDRWRASAVAVTLGEAGALLVHGDSPPLVVPAPPLSGGDSCGAGDCFAATAAALLADGALPSEAVAGAVQAASAFVAAGGAAAVSPAARSPSRPVPPNGFAGAGRGAEEVVAQVRARQGTVVATGGCFDLLHTGHVSTLRQARALGDCLVVCLNSDPSVRRLKGPDRPVVPQEDRAALLLALDCVDAVVVFDEDTPAEVLDLLRPDIFAKGGDYALSELPETEVMRRWGGQVVVLPYVEGRSTTDLLARSAGRRGIGMDAE